MIGFPNGYHTTETKVFETKNALQNGADEIDMVINLGWVKDGLFDLIEQEIKEVKKACGNHILKVIIETCYLTQQEKKILCQVVSRSKADFIKTSTGFGTGGATAEEFLQLGAQRLGSSSLLEFLKA